ncbi:adhesion G protein-coupled receptor E2-like [Engraulis encrasicolus]|uniref:adhesion G protein-coupled receptor E2-like n=1 Tax=Engraulis encrasicolus TaxID=184585 RepID=UPI002FD76DAF
MRALHTALRVAERKRFKTTYSTAPTISTSPFAVAMSVATDDNECEQDPSICGDHARCYNTEGSYFCICDTGYSSSKVTFTAEDPPCKDINECTEKGKNACGPYEQCINTHGSYWCECRGGYRKDDRGEQECKDVDECVMSPLVCGPKGNCTNTPGSYTCSCVEGFKMSTVTGYCEDDNECDTVPVYPSICGEHAQCLNTKGSYYCECEEGYQSPKGPKFTADDPKCQG